MAHPCACLVWSPKDRWLCEWANFLHGNWIWFLHTQIKITLPPVSPVFFLCTWIHTSSHHFHCFATLLLHTHFIPPSLTFYTLSRFSSHQTVLTHSIMCTLPIEAILCPAFISFHSLSTTSCLCLPSSHISKSSPKTWTWIGAFAGNTWDVPFSNPSA